MSKKSAASLAVVAMVPGKRPNPPKSLTDAEAAWWRAATNTKPADWFTPDTYPLLLQYCRHSARADRVAARLALMDMMHGDAMDDRDEYDRLTAHSDRESKALTNLARQLRISQQSMLTPGAAGTQSRKSAGEKKPWE